MRSFDYPIDEQPVEGLTIFNDGAVKNVENSVLALGLVSAAINAIDARCVPYKPTSMYELMLSDEVDVEDAVLWLGKAQKLYGGDFAALEIQRATASNRAAESIMERLPSLFKDGMRFVFVVEGDILTEAQERRADRLKGKLGELAIPSMRLRPSIVPPAEIGAGVHQPDARAEDAVEPHLVVESHFTIDQRLEYPLILRRTPELEEPGPDPDQLSITD